MSLQPARINPQNIPQLKARKSPRDPRGPFADLTWPQQRAAEQWLWKFCQRWEGNLPPWRRAILIGTAKRLALYPPPPGWGFSQLCRQGARAGIARFRREGVLSPQIIAMRRGRERKQAEKIFACLG